MPWASWFDGSPPRHLVVVRALPGLGDLLCIVPALRALRAEWPEAEIDLLGLPAAQAFVQRFSRYVNGLIEFPGFPGIKERPPIVRQLPAFLTEMHRKTIDLALQMHGNGLASNQFTLLLGARQTAGFCVPSAYCPDPERFLTYPAFEPEVRRHLRLLEFMGVPLRGEELEFPLNDRDWESFNSIPASRDLMTGEYVCVHAGASEVQRRWAPEQFAVVADALASRGYQIVLTGTKAEAETAQAVADKMTRPILCLAGQTDLGSLAVLLSRARLLICNDTGVSHLAAALGTRSVIIFLASDRDRWAPLDYRRHRPVGWPPSQILRQNCGDVLARPCLRDVCEFPGSETGSKAQVPTPTLVLQEAESLLDEVLNVA